ncbi:enoyl-CoA hydratase [soil metagenome]
MTTTTGPTIIVSREKQTLVLTLSNPGFRNAMGPEMYGPLRQALVDAAQDADIRCIVLTGADGVFSAGGNLNRLLANRAKPPSAQEDSISGVNAVVLALQQCPLPVIAAVEGAAAGAGLSLALACDLVIAGTSVKFAMSHVRVGLSPDAGGSWFAMRNLPRQAAAELMLEGDVWPAERMRELGLVNQVVADGSVLATALARADRLAALSPNSIAHIKALMNDALTQDLKAQLESEKKSFVDCLFHPHAGEAISAFLEKRKPQFKS